MKNNPKISVVILDVNDSSAMERTLISVNNQNYNKVEIIVASRGSCEASYKENIEYYGEVLDQQEILLIQERIEGALGVYIYIIAAGNCFHNANVLQDLLDGHDENTDIICGNYLGVYPDGLTVNKNFKNYLLIREFKKEYVDIFPACLIKREVFSIVKYYDQNIKYTFNWVFILKALQNDIIKFIYKDVLVSDVKISRAGNLHRMSQGHLISKERVWVLNNYLCEKLELVDTENLLDRQEKLIDFFKYYVRSARSIWELKQHVKSLSNSFFSIPIIINNRNHLTYLKRLINSLEKKGYKNIYIIDNSSEYTPLMNYYKDIPYKVFRLDQNVGFCALWDTNIFDYFKDTYYIYTDSDIEIIDECPNDFVGVLHYLLNKYSLGKIGLSLLTDDLPDIYANKEEVQIWEQQFSKERIERLVYNAQVDTTFALYKPNEFGYAGMMPCFRTTYPYSARHLPWYEDTANLTQEQKHYYRNAKTSSHWSEKINSED